MKRSLSESRVSWQAYASFRLQKARQYLGYFATCLQPSTWCVDVGCGLGSMVQALTDTPVLPLGVDRSRDALARACRFHGNCMYLRADAACLPLRDAAVSCVVTISNLEHVDAPAEVLADLHRVLSAQGLLVAAFPPYWSPGGHHLYDYTLLPVQFLPNQWVRRLVLRKGDIGIVRAVAAWRQYAGLNRLTIRWFHKLANRYFACVKEKGLVFLPGPLPDLTLSVTKLPFWLRRFVVMFYMGIWRKQ